MNPTTPAPPRIRVEGALDMVRASDQTFTLRQPDGRELPGRLVRGSIAGLGRVLGRPLIVFGAARLGPAGELQSVEADGYIPNDGKPWTLSPEDLPLSRDVAEEQARRLQQAVGTWPGDETDEEVEQALRGPS
jgi:hypothetical protein